MFMSVGVCLGLVAATLVTSQKVVDLSRERWILQNRSLNISVPGSVPSQAHLDLFKHKLIEEPTYGTRFACLCMSQPLTKHRFRRSHTSVGCEC